MRLPATQHLGALLFCAAALLFSRCGVTDSAPEVRPQYAYSHQDSVEALHAALWFSGSLEAPQEEFAFQLFWYKHLRTLCKDSLEFDSLIGFALGSSFLPPWIPGDILVKFDSAAAARIRGGAYGRWHLLPDGMIPDTLARMPDALGWVRYRYGRAYHPRRLAELFRALPGVVVAEPNYISSLSDYNAIPTVADGRRGYFFYSGWPGPYVAVYFEIDAGAPRFAGRHDGSAYVPPSWHDAIAPMLNNFAAWDGIPR